MKYIVVQDEYGTEHIVIFHGSASHKFMANGRPVLGAGFIRVVWDGYNNRIKPECHGMSESLGIVSRERDTDLAEMTLNSGG